ncbi:MAG: hypothetical protein HW415_1429 [Deltaproteobacteria bacterium]|nr:hypothetical protein [Deltaproteobacteria bacterium]
MKEKSVYCEAVKANVMKSARCPEYECKTCPELKTSKASPIKPKKKKTPKTKNSISEVDLLKLWPVYTKHPPIKEVSIDAFWNDTIPTESGIFPDMKVDGIPLSDLLRGKHDSFNETKNPVYAIETFLLAHMHGLYPPLWALEYLAGVFTEWHKANGIKKFDEVFGIKIKGKGKRTHPFEALLIEDRNERLCWQIFCLNLLFNISIEDAAKMVLARLKAIPGWDKTGWELREVEHTSLEKYYYTKGSKLYNIEPIRNGLLKWMRDEKLSFLKSFPKKSFPLLRSGEPKYAHLEELLSNS